MICGCFQGTFEILGVLVCGGNGEINFMFKLATTRAKIALVQT
jgi:hypothetical protein